MSSKTRLALDILERAVWTWAEGFVGLLIIGGFFDDTAVGDRVAFWSSAQKAAIAAAPAALAVVKGLFASLVGRNDSAATLPAEVD